MSGRLKQDERLHQKMDAVRLQCQAVILMIYSHSSSQEVYSRKVLLPQLATGYFYTRLTWKLNAVWRNLSISATDTVSKYSILAKMILNKTKTPEQAQLTLLKKYLKEKKKQSLAEHM